MGSRLLGEELLISIQHHVEVKFLLQQLQSVMAKGLHWAH